MGVTNLIGVFLYLFVDKEIGSIYAIVAFSCGACYLFDYLTKPLFYINLKINDITFGQGQVPSRLKLLFASFLEDSKLLALQHVKSQRA